MPMSLPDAVATLGHTKEYAASVLREHEVTGRRHDHCHCPVAVYLAMKMEIGEEQVSASQHTITRLVPGHVMLWETVSTPTHVAHLIYDFDNGKYPDLLLTD